MYPLNSLKKVKNAQQSLVQYRAAGTRKSGLEGATAVVRAVTSWPGLQKSRLHHHHLLHVMMIRCIHRCAPYCHVLLKVSSYSTGIQKLRIIPLDQIVLAGALEKNRKIPLGHLRISFGYQLF